MTKQLASIVVALVLCLVGCGAFAERVPLITGPPSDPAATGCFAADVAGLLVVDPTYGTAIVNSGLPSMIPVGEVPVTVAWRPGFSARRSGSEVEVLDPLGRVVAITGRSYRFEGGYVSAGGSSGIHWPELRTRVIWACGNPTEALPFVPPTQDEIRNGAARAYTQAVTTIVRARDDVLQRYKNDSSLKSSKTFCWKLAYVERDFLVALQGLTYPDDAKAHANALMRNQAAQVAALRTCAKAPNVTRLNRAMDLANEARDRAHDASNVLRLDLGLDPLPG